LLVTILVQMPHGRGGKNSRGKGRKNIEPGLSHFLASSTSSGSAVRVRNLDDATRAPLTPDLSRVRMPKNIQTQIHWFTASQILSTTLTVGAITEFNQSFNIAQTAIGGAITGLFDQYAIYAVNCRIIHNIVGANAVSVPEYVTALDFDNVNNLGSVNLLLGYGTAMTTDFNEVQERVIKPCNAPALYSGSGFSHFGQARMWVDSANTTTPHYGLRYIANALGTGVTGTVAINVTFVICARNSI